MPQKILFFEPHFGGSHRAFAKGLATHTPLDITLLTQPGMHWKWRMRGSALYFKENAPDLNAFDTLMVSNMVDVSRLRGFFPKLPKVVVYMHESQLTYPVPKGASLGVDLVLQEIYSLLSADGVIFNSKNHMERFLSAIPDFFGRFPDCLPKDVEKRIGEKSSWIYPGVSLPEAPVEKKGNDCPLLIWNHRWSFDKNFEATLHALKVLAGKGHPFHVALLGERAGGKAEAPFHEALSVLGDRVVHFGFCESREAYLEWLKAGDVVLSSAIQENFGISVVEAMGHGCFPLVPDRLAYPEVVPESLHEASLYSSQRDYIDRLEGVLTDGIDPAMPFFLHSHAQQFSWKRLSTSYVDALAG